MQSRNGKVLELALLARIAAAGAGDRFALRDVCRLDAAIYVNALASLVDRGCVERVTERCGAWFYRLTPLGAVAHATKRLPVDDGLDGGTLHCVRGLTSTTRCGRGFQKRSNYKGQK